MRALGGVAHCRQRSANVQNKPGVFLHTRKDSEANLLKLSLLAEGQSEHHDFIVTLKKQTQTKTKL